MGHHGIKVSDQLYYFNSGMPLTTGFMSVSSDLPVLHGRYPFKTLFFQAKSIKFTIGDLKSVTVLNIQ